MDEQPENFTQLLDQVLEPNSRVYASPWIGDDKMHSLIYHDNTEKVIFSQTEISGLEEYFKRNDRVNSIPYSVKDYALDLNTTGAGVDYEFAALPGTGATSRGGMQIDNVSMSHIADDWAAISDRLVRDKNGSVYYLDTLWADEISPRSDELTLDMVHEEEEQALKQYFDETGVIEGSDYSLVYGHR